MVEGQVDGAAAAPPPPPVSASAESPEVFAAKHEFYVIALRVWLAGLGSREKRVRSGYVTWQRGTTWPSPNRFDDSHGKFSGLRQEAERANRAERWHTGAAVPPELLARAEELHTWLNPSRQRAMNAGAREGAFDFATALRAALDDEWVRWSSRQRLRRRYTRS